MPYKGPGDPNLPAHVLKLPEAEQAHWIEVFNSVLSKTGDEGEAMRQANGVIKGVELSEVPLFPFGTFKTEKYGKIDLDEELADELIHNFHELQPKIIPFVDKNHEAGESYGWVKRLFKGAFRHPQTGQDVPALMADIEWNEAGKRAIADRQYRQLSIWTEPLRDEETGKSYRSVLRSVSLTNIPVLRMLPDLALSEDKGEVEIPLDTPELALGESPGGEAVLHPLLAEFDAILSKGEDFWRGMKGAPTLRTYLKEVRARLAAMNLREPAGQLDEHEKKRRKDMDLKEILAALKLDEGTPEDKVLEAMTKMAEDMQAKDKEIGEAKAELEAKEQELAEARKGQGDKEKQLAELAGKVTELEMREAKRDCDRVIDLALTEGRILPAHREKWEKLYMADPEGAGAMIAELPKVVELGASHGTSGDAGGSAVQVMMAEVKKLQDSGSLSFSDALAQVSRERPELAEKYLEEVRR